MAGTRIDPLIVTSVNPNQIAQCLRVNDQEFQCFLRGDTTSIKITVNESEETCKVTTRKIRFAAPDFFTRMNEEIQDKKEDERILKLCSFLVQQIVEGKVVIENKKDGKIEAITGVAIANQIREKKSKKTNLLKYDKVEVAGTNFFKEIAKQFAAELEKLSIVREASMQKKDAVDPTTPEGVRLETERKIITKTQSRWNLWASVLGFKDAVVNFFNPKETKENIEAIILSESRRQIDAAHRRAVEQKNRDFDNTRYERLQDNIKWDKANQEKRLDRQKLESKAAPAA